MYKKWSTLKKLIWLKYIGAAGGAVWKTVTGAIVTFVTNLINPLRLTATLEPIQDGSGDPSPTNVRPISGHTGVTVYDTAENMIPISVPSNVIAGTFNTSSTTIASASNARVFAIPVPKNTDIHVQKKIGNTNGHTIALGDTGSIAIGTPLYEPYGITNGTDKNYNTGGHTWLYVMSSTLELAEALFSTTEFMVSLGTERIDYVAPTGSNTYPITFPALGKNLFDSANATMVGGYYINANGAIQANIAMKYCADYIQVSPSTGYAIGCTKTNTIEASVSVAYYDSSKTFISRDLVVSPTSGAIRISGTFTTPSTAAYIRFNSPAASIETQIEKGSSATAYEAFNNTVYYGTLSVNEDGTGEIVATDAAVACTSDQSGWTRSTSYPGGFYRTASYFGLKAYSVIICSHAKYVASLSDYLYGMCYVDNSINIRIMPSGSSLDDWKNYLDAQVANGTPVTVCSKLITPITIPLTASQITTFKGTNVIWVDDSDEITVQYLA